MVVDANPTVNGGFKVRLHLGDRQKGVRKTWARHVEKVDTNERGGYAFMGDWVRSGDEVPAGAWLIVITASGTVTNPANSLELYKIEHDGENLPLITVPYTTREDVADAVEIVAKYVNDSEEQKAQRDIKLYTAVTALVKEYGVNEVRKVLEAVAKEF